jgi:acyl-coenzyme A synthetase/AMP-(fatty) acid ligase
MYLDFLYERFAESPETEALIYRHQPTRYRELLEYCHEAEAFLARNDVERGSIVALAADYSPRAIAMLLALAEHRCTTLQVGHASGQKLDDMAAIGEIEILLHEEDHGFRLERTGRKASHALYATLREQQHPGLVLFSSGSTGAIKGTVHDLSRLLKKFHKRRHSLRTIAFLLFDHIGGIDTLFYSLSNASTLILVDKRDPATICEAVEKHRAQVLPAAPTFLNLLYFSKEYTRFDLSSLEYVTYGAEMMPEQTLAFCREMFPTAKLVQRYGTSEVGSPRSQSKSSDSLWVRIGGEGYEWRVVDGILQIKAESAMLGYLNAPSPFTEDGWFVTGDCVEVDGEYIRFLGRKSDIINVGGKKVYPAEVEAVLKQMPEVVEATVQGEPNVLLGNIVTARVWLASEGTDEAAMRTQLKQFVAKRLDSFKVPVKISFSYDSNYATDRFKKVRSPGAV